MPIARVLTIAAAVASLVGGFQPSQVKAQVAPSEIMLEYFCTPNGPGRCKCDVTPGGLPAEVEQLRSKARCRVVRRTGEVLVTFINETSFLPGTQFSEVGPAVPASSCDSGEEFRPHIQTVRTRVVQTGTRTVLKTRTQVRMCDPTTS